MTHTRGVARQQNCAALLTECGALPNLQHNAMFSAAHSRRAVALSIAVIRLSLVVLVLSTSIGPVGGAVI